MKKKLSKIALFVFLALIIIFPIFVSAQGLNTDDPGAPGQTFGTASKCLSAAGSISNVICHIQEILNSLVPLLVALGVVYFVWGVVMYVIADGEEAKKAGRDRMIYGIIGLAAIIGLFGLVNIVVTTFGIGGTASIPSLAPVGSVCSVPDSSSTVGDLFAYITCYIGRFGVPLIFALALVMFVWGVVQFVINSDEEAKKEKGRQFMIWGVIALTVMMSVWGLVSILGATFGLNTSVLPHVCPPGQSNCP